MADADALPRTGPPGVPLTPEPSLACRRHRVMKAAMPLLLDDLGEPRQRAWFRWLLLVTVGWCRRVFTSSEQALATPPPPLTGGTCTLPGPRSPIPITQ